MKVLRLCCYLAAGISLLGTPAASSAEAASAAKVCRRSCTTALDECLTTVRQEQTTRLAACKSGTVDRRACRRKVTRATRATGRACRNLRKGCTACCRAGGTACDRPQVTRDQVRAASGLIAISGGTVTATAADGTTYTLTVPADALLDDTTITLTPVTAIGGFPIGRDLVAAVDAEPSGLLFLKPATLTITLPGAPAGRLVGFGYEGDGTDFHGELLGVDGTTAQLFVTHFSGFGGGPESSPELRALLTRPPSNPSLQFGTQFGNLPSQGVTDPQTYIDVLRRWYQQVIRPGLQGAVGSDSRLRQALADYDGWLLDVKQGAFILGFGFDLDTPLRPEQAEALGLIAAALRDAIARADARCLAQHSLAEAETALEWQVIADAADVDTTANALDLDTVVDGLCVEAHYDNVTYPATPPLLSPSTLEITVGLVFSDGVPATGDRMGVVVIPHGATVAGNAIGDTDGNGKIMVEFTPVGDRELRLDIHSCGNVPGRRRLNRVCQDAFVVRGVEVSPPQAALALGASEQFAATLLGRPLANATWSATGGTIDASGKYTAPGTAGTFEVRATNPVDGKSGTGTVTVGTPTTTTLPGNGPTGTYSGTYTFLSPVDQDCPCSQPGVASVQDNSILHDGSHIDLLAPTIIRLTQVDLWHLSIDGSGGFTGTPEACDSFSFFGPCSGAEPVVATGSASGGVLTFTLTFPFSPNDRWTFQGLLCSGDPPSCP